MTSMVLDIVLAVLLVSYAFTGYRLANRYNPAAVRIGFGVSSSFPFLPGPFRR